MFEVLPVKETLFLSTNEGGGCWKEKVIATQVARHQSSVDSCCFTRAGMLASFCRKLGTLTWASTDLKASDTVVDADIREILAIGEGWRGNELVVGDLQGRVWAIQPGDISKRNRGQGPAVAFSEAVESLFTDRDNEVVACGKSGKVRRIPLFSGLQAEILVAPPGYREQQSMVRAGAQGAFWSLFCERVEGASQTVLELVIGRGREIRVLTTPQYVTDISVNDGGDTICLAGRSVKVFQYAGGELVERYSRDVAAHKVVFVGSALLAVALSSEPWLEVWQLSDGLPTVGAQFAPSPITALCAQRNIVAAGLGSGELLVLELRGSAEGK